MQGIAVDLVSMAGIVYRPARWSLDKPIGENNYAVRAAEVLSALYVDVL